MSPGPVVVLAGGVGAARFLRGLTRVVPPEEIIVIGNTGDDMWWHGLYIAPDLDTVTYWLAGVADESRGWGIRGDTFTAQAALAQLTDRSWFQLGDRDLATHLYRTGRLADGVPLHRVTAELAERLGVRSRLLPMSDAPVETRLKTDAGDLHFQEYFVRERSRPTVHEIYWTGLDEASPTPGVAEALESARLVLIAPSNPSISIEPILRVPGMRALVGAARGKTVAVSPLIGGRAVKGPTVELMRAEGRRPDALGVAERYRELASGFVLDTADAALAPAIAALGYRIAVRPTMLDDLDSARGVASAALDVLSQPAAA
jgi:LPPG:FO 2-phospho-L-lactate transferase